MLPDELLEIELLAICSACLAAWETARGCEARNDDACWPLEWLTAVVCAAGVEDVAEAPFSPAASAVLLETSRAKQTPTKSAASSGKKLSIVERLNLLMTS
jgi:hypothetical protein